MDFRNITKLLIASLLLLNIQCISKKSSSTKSNKPDVILTLIHFNDGESKLLSAGKRLENVGGIARFATVVNNIRAKVKDDQHPHCYITVTSGDNFLAGPAFDVSLQKGIPYFDAVALDLIGVDALALGNHDFDFGPEVLANFIKSFQKSSPVFLSSNLDFSQEPQLQELVDSGKIVASAIMERQNHRFGLIGLATPNLPFLSSPRRVTVQDDLIACVQQEVEILKNKGINKIILITHLQGIVNDIELISQIREIDIVVAGGGNELLANSDDILISHQIKNKNIIEEKVYGPYPMVVRDYDNKKVPIVTTSGEYRYVGYLQVSFNTQGEIIHIHKNSSPMRVVSTTYKDGVTPDSQVTAEVILPLEQALDAMKKNMIGTSEINLGGNRNIVRSSEIPLGNLVADALLWAARKKVSEYNAPMPDIAMINGGSIRAGIAAGTFSELDIFRTLPFSTPVTIVEKVAPHDLKHLLENSYSHIDANGGIEGVSGTGRFAQIAGLRVAYNSARNPGKRIKEVRLANNKPIVLNYEIVKNAPYVNLATINFLVRGGDEWNVGNGKKVNLGTTHRHALSDFIKAPLSEGGLNGKITSAQYSDSKIRRIVQIRE